MLVISSTKENLKKHLTSFIWEFKIGDNILYNLDVVYNLIEDHNNAQKCNYAKPVSILCVSIMEAVLVDFLERLNMATSQFPNKLASKRSEIKNKLNGEKKIFQQVYQGEAYQYRRLRNFGYQDLVKFCEEFSLLGPSSKVYRNLERMGRFRNRVHINNYFGNFERDESRAFSETRTQEIIYYMIKMLKYLEKHYSRP